MTPFVRVQREASTAMLQRTAMMALPLEFFAKFFGGRVPTVQEKIFWIEQSLLQMTDLNVYENNLYQVSIVAQAPFIRLSIRRHDGQPGKDWKHFQQIKNALIGPEHEAVELFPSERRLIDTNNEYHLWVHTDPRFRFSFGFDSGRVVLDSAVTFESVHGAAPRSMLADSAVAKPAPSPSLPV